MEIKSLPAPVPGTGTGTGTWNQYGQRYKYLVRHLLIGSIYRNAKRKLFLKVLHLKQTDSFCQWRCEFFGEVLSDNCFKLPCLSEYYDTEYSPFYSIILRFDSATTNGRAVGTTRADDKLATAAMATALR